MKRNYSYKFLFSFIFLFSLTFLLTSSCHRNQDCTAVINVIDDSTSAPVAGATVHMYPPPSSANLSIQDQTSTTDGSGSVSFTFKLPAILQADVKGGIKGNGSALVKTEAGKQVSKTIKVY
jgi:hypothetical protein